MFLSREDVVRLTGRQRYSAQKRKLDELGIRYMLAGTGEPLVRAADLDGATAPARNRGPRWDRIGA